MIKQLKVNRQSKEKKESANGYHQYIYQQTHLDSGHFFVQLLYIAFLVHLPGIAALSTVCHSGRVWQDPPSSSEGVLLKANSRLEQTEVYH